MSLQCFFHLVIFRIRRTNFGRSLVFALTRFYCMVHIFYKGFSSFTLLVLIYFTGVDFGHSYVDSGVKFEISLQNPKIVLQSRFFYMSNSNFLYRYVQQSIRNIPKITYTYTVCPIIIETNIILMQP